MHKFYTGVVNHRRKIMVFFAVAAVICLFLSNLVAVNYDMNIIFLRNQHQLQHWM